MKLKSFTRNGITIKYPSGYKGPKDYLSGLHTNLGIIDRLAGKYPPTLRADYLKSIAQAEQALGVKS